MTKGLIRLYVFMLKHKFRVHSIFNGTDHIVVRLMDNWPESLNGRQNTLYVLWENQ